MRNEVTDDAEKNMSEVRATERRMPEVRWCVAARDKRPGIKQLGIVVLVLGV